MQALILFHLQNEYVCGLLGLAELHTEFARIVTGLDARVIELALLVVEGLRQGVQLVLKLGILSTNACQLFLVLLILDAKIIGDLGLAIKGDPQGSHLLLSFLVLIMRFLHEFIVTFDRPVDLVSEHIFESLAGDHLAGCLVLGAECVELEVKVVVEKTQSLLLLERFLTRKLILLLE